MIRRFGVGSTTRAVKSFPLVSSPSNTLQPANKPFNFQDVYKLAHRVFSVPPSSVTNQCHDFTSVRGDELLFQPLFEPDEHNLGDADRGHRAFERDRNPQVVEYTARVRYEGRYPELSYRFEPEFEIQTAHFKVLTREAEDREIECLMNKIHRLSCASVPTPSCGQMRRPFPQCCPMLAQTRANTRCVVTVDPAPTPSVC